MAQAVQAQPPPALQMPVEHHVAIYCPYCNQWLNGHVQWRDHRLTGRHRRYKRSTTRNERSACKPLVLLVVLLLQVVLLVKLLLVRKAAKGGG